MRNTRDILPGERFHKLLIVRECERDKWGKKSYLCQCDCGKTLSVRKTYLFFGRVKSCGCLREKTWSENGKKQIHHAIEKRRNFVGRVSGSMWGRILRNAEFRKLNVEIDQKYVSDLYEKQGGKCALTGKKISLSPFSKNASDNTASLDRIDSSKGYIPSNVRWVHKYINLMKNHFSDKLFIEYCKCVIANDKKRNNQFIV